METGIPIDVTDPDDIRTKLPQLEDLIRLRRRELDRLDAVADRLATLAGIRRRDSGGRTRTRRTARPSPDRTPSAQEAVVDVVNRSGGAMTISDVMEQIDLPFKRDTVSWALWQAEQDKQLKRVAKGVYAPLNYKVTELTPRLTASGGAAKE